MEASEDRDIYSRANDEGRIAVVFNTKHFEPLLKKNSSTIFAVSPNMEYKNVDNILQKILSEMKESEVRGKIYFVSNNGVRVEEVMNEKR